MENITRIIRSYLAVIAVFFLASTAYLQAQRTPYVSGDLTITTDADVPSDVATITTITGALSISGTITEFPNFRDLEVVQGRLSIDDITTGTLTTLTDIFPALDTIRGNLVIRNQSVVETIGGFVALDSVGGLLFIEDNTSLTSVSGFGALTDIGVEPED